MRITILIPRSEFTSLSQNTWDRIEVRDIVTHYYESFKDDLSGINPETVDFVFHATSYSYIHKIRLRDYAFVLPWKKCYTGNDLQQFISFDMLKAISTGEQVKRASQFQSVDFFKTYNDTEPYHYDCYHENHEKIKSAMQFLFKKHFT